MKKVINVKLGVCQPKQKEFMLATAKYVAFGGARGGGKSWSVREKAKRLAIKWAGIKIAIIRRTYKDLQGNHIDPLKNELPIEFARYKEKDARFTFVNGSLIDMRYFANDNDALNFQGQEYDVIFLEEATQHGEKVYNVLKACIRGVNNFPKRMYFTCNPGGKGHQWVKRLFIDKQYKDKEKPEDYIFIQATVDDNQILVKTNPDYVEQLDSLPDALKQAWRYGNWDVFDGQFFNEFDRNVHVCEPFVIPKNWLLYTSMDYGLDMLAHFTYAIDEKGDVYVINELYKSGLIVSDAIKEINSITRDLNIITRFAPPDLWAKETGTGRSTVDLFSERGIYLQMANNNRISGWLAVKELMKVVESLAVDGKVKKTSRLHIFSNCVNLIRTLPMLQYDDRIASDVAKDPHELTHAPDALRYFAVSYTDTAEGIKMRNKDSWIYNTSDTNASVYDDYYN